MIKNQKLLKSVAEERVRKLLSIAKNRTVRMGGSDQLSKRYINMADSIISRYKISPIKEFKREVCPSCKSVLIPGVNCSVRLAGTYGYIAYRCKCGEETHVFYKQ